MTDERPRKRRAVVANGNGDRINDYLQYGVRGNGIPLRPATGTSHHHDHHAHGHGHPTQHMIRQAEYQREVDTIRFEVEPIKVKTGTDNYTIKYIPTMKGLLGQKGYLVRDKLGKGSYSQVRLAINVPRVKYVAIKIVDKSLAPQDFRERFLPRELQIWPRLRHPHIVRMFHHFEDVRRIYAVLEYAPGGDALRYIQMKGAVSSDHAKVWMLQLGDAVRYLHFLGVAHRDLKLENLMLDSASNIKLCDFGFARECGTDLSSTYCGSKSYAAPEILSGTLYDPKKADIWALGVILFIFVTGKMPFDERKGNTGLLEDHASLKFYWPTKVPQQCKQTILSTLKYEFKDRPDIVSFLSQPWFQTYPYMPRSSYRQATATISDPTVSYPREQRHNQATAPPTTKASGRQLPSEESTSDNQDQQQRQQHSHHHKLVTMSPDGQRQ